MTQTNDTTRVFISLTQRRRNGRPRILPPEPEAHFQSRSQDPHILKALGRAWAWRRRLEAGEAATIQEIAKAEGDRVPLRGVTEAGPPRSPAGPG
jgi:hypothetical protein